MKEGGLAVGIIVLLGALGLTGLALGALASRDWRPMHHDYKFATERNGVADIFLNTPNQAAWFERYVTDWAGPAAQIRKVAIRLGAPNYPGDTMTFTGEVTHADADSRTVVVSLKGKNSMGNHVTGTATLVLP